MKFRSWSGRRVKSVAFAHTRIFTALLALLLLSVAASRFAQAVQPSQAPVTLSTQLPPDIQAKIDAQKADVTAAHAANDSTEEGLALVRLGLIYFGINQPQQALDYLNRALLVFHGADVTDGEGIALANMGIVYMGQNEPRKAMDTYDRALVAYRAAGDRDGAARVLTNIGNIYHSQSDPQKALDAYEHALTIYREVEDHDGEAMALASIGIIYQLTSEQEKALDFLNQALPIFHAAGNQTGEAKVLVNIGNVYQSLGEPQKALDAFTQALPVFEAAGDRDTEARTLSDIGAVYEGLGATQKALEGLDKALSILRALDDRGGEAMALANIGNTYRLSGDLQKALDYYNQALPTYRSAGDRHGEASVLDDIGGIYHDLHQARKALEYYNQALPIKREVGDRDAEATTLNNIGMLHIALGQRETGLDYLNQALLLAREAGNPLKEAIVCQSMMVAQHSARPVLAIFYGKRAVNLLQQVRSNIQGLDKDLQASFLASKDDYYRQLADLLITQGRLPEAEQVLDLLKQQEFTDFVRGSPTTMLSPLTLTAAEQQAEADYEQSTATLVNEAAHWQQLKQNTARTSEEEKEFQGLSASLAKANQQLSAYYTRLFKLLGAGSAANTSLADIKGDVAILKNQIARTPHAVGLRTVVGEDVYSVIVVTSAASVARHFSITRSELNQKIADFQQALRNPAHDPRPAAHELYKILIGPVQADLDQAQAQTLIWSLDGALRYIPMAALYDGTTYLVQKYNSVAVTTASYDHLGDQPDMDQLTAIAMGISRRYESDLNPLPSVVSELDDIVKDPKVAGADGVLPGSILLDGQFTQKAMEDGLSGQHAIVHIASHFVLKPGDENASYLLLAGKDTPGSGYHLTVADFRDDPNLSLAGTSLLTLSACDTGVDTASNGVEVDGLASVAQRQGAEAVISSLWEVNDTSTGALMADFYKRWADGHGKVMKVEALRQAQLDLLSGRTTSESNGAGRGFDVVPETQSPSTPRFTHPYYWAPFVLTGNWR